MYRCCTITVLDHLYDHCVDAAVLNTIHITRTARKETCGSVLALLEAPGGVSDNIS